MLWGDLKPCCYGFLDAHLNILGDAVQVGMDFRPELYLKIQFLLDLSLLPEIFLGDGRSLVSHARNYFGLQNFVFEKLQSL